MTDRSASSPMVVDMGPPQAVEVVSEADRHFIQQRERLLQDIDKTMYTILDNMSGLNITLESSIAVGKQFESVAELWRTFYDGLTQTDDDHVEDLPDKSDV